MKAIIEFNLPEESMEHLRASRANDLCLALSSIDESCRESIKHGHTFKTVEDALQEIRDVINDVRDLLY